MYYYTYEFAFTLSKSKVRQIASTIWLVVVQAVRSFHHCGIRSSRCFLKSVDIVIRAVPPGPSSVIFCGSTG